MTVQHDLVNLRAWCQCGILAKNFESGNYRVTGSPLGVDINILIKRLPARRELFRYPGESIRRRVFIIHNIV